MLKREKRRYLALEVVSEQPLNEQKLLDAIQSSIQRLFGEYGASQANLKLIKTVPEKRQSVIRCSHKTLDQIRAAIASITAINGKDATVHVLGVSGTLNALFKKIQNV